MDAGNSGRGRVFLAAVAILLAAGAPAVAGPPVQEPGPPEAGLGPALDVESLATLRGGDGQLRIDVDNVGTVEGNTANQVVTGDNRIDGGAFANAAGLTTVIQHSGSNVLIQSGAAVNVRFGSGP